MKIQSGVTGLFCSSVPCGPGLSPEALRLMLTVPFTLYLSSPVLASPDTLLISIALLTHGVCVAGNL